MRLNYHTQIREVKYCLEKTQHNSYSDSWEQAALSLANGTSHDAIFLNDTL